MESIVTIVMWVIGGLCAVASAFFWNKIRELDNYRKEISDLQKDVNMAHTKIGIVEASAATTGQLNQAVNDFRSEVTSILDKQEQRTAVVISRIEESIRNLQISFREDLKEILIQIKNRD